MQSARGKRFKAETNCMISSSKPQEEVTGKPNIRRVQVAPNPAGTVAFDRKFNDLHLTPTAYRHLLLEADQGTGKPPFLTGPTLIHM